MVNKRLTMDTFREWEYFALLLAVVIFCTSNILAIEYKTSMVNLISANKHGKARLLIIKLLTVLITTVISYILIYLPYMLKTFGTASFDLPLVFKRFFGSDKRHNRGRIYSCSRLCSSACGSRRNGFGLSALLHI